MLSVCTDVFTNTCRHKDYVLHCLTGNVVLKRELCEKWTETVQNIDNQTLETHGYAIKKKQ